MSAESLALLLAQGGNVGEGPGWDVIFLLGFVVVVAIWGGLAAIVLLVVRRRAPGRPPVAKLILAGFGLGLPTTGAAIASVLLLDSPIAPFVVVYFGSLFGYCWLAGRALLRGELQGD